MFSIYILFIYCYIQINIYLYLLFLPTPIYVVFISSSLCDTSIQFDASVQFDESAARSAQSVRGVGRVGCIRGPQSACRACRTHVMCRKRLASK